MTFSFHSDSKYSQLLGFPPALFHCVLELTTSGIQTDWWTSSNHKNNSYAFPEVILYIQT